MFVFAKDSKLKPNKIFGQGSYTKNYSIAIANVTARKNKSPKKSSVNSENRDANVAQR
jgi:hypothetical protein